MMPKNNKQDNEVYILGSESSNERGKKSRLKWLWMVLAACALVAVAAVFFLQREETPEYYFESEEAPQQTSTVTTTHTATSSGEKGYIEEVEEVVNDVSLTIYVPHGANMSLFLGMPDKEDSTIIFAAMAADIRKDNMQIVGDFVLSGKRLSRGVAKKGFCAIDNDQVTIGVGDSTPLLQQVIDNKGYFFRQYPLVYNGDLVENKPKNKSIRRALAIRDDQVIMIESKGRESFHDFSQALIDIGVTQAIYLVGGDAFGWYRDKEHVQRIFGEERPDFPESISYIVWQIE